MSEEHIIGRLLRLQSVVQAAIDWVRSGEMRSCTPAEEAEHAQLYGEGAWALGEFVINDRNATLASATAYASAEGDLPRASDLSNA